MPNGGYITIQTGNNNDGLFINISDTGIGMDEETKKRIFQPFYTTKGFEAGRGLGMSGVYSIVKGYGGNIFVKSSELNKGTSIEITFPYVDQEEQIENRTNEEKLLTNQSIYNILWVEDDNLIRESSSIMAKALGHNCDTASSGQIALELLDDKIYDIVITDIGMSEMNGWQLADIIYDKFGDKIVVGVVSGWGDTISEEEKREHNVKYVLGKPFTIEQLDEMFIKLNTEIQNKNCDLYSQTGCL